MQESAWSELAMVEVQPDGQSAVQFAAITETIDVDMGDKDIEQVATLSGGRLVKKVPQDVISVTLEMYPVDIDAHSGSGISKWFLAAYAAAGSEPLSSVVARTRTKVRLTCLWTNDSTPPTGASSATADSTDSYRFALADAYIVSCKPSFTDGILKFTVTFKAPPFDKSGNGNWKEELADNKNLAALAAYSGSTKW